MKQNHCPITSITTFLTHYSRYIAVAPFHPPMHNTISITYVNKYLQRYLLSFALNHLPTCKELMMVKIHARTSDSLSTRNKSPKIQVPQSSGNNAITLIINNLHNIRKICMQIHYAYTCLHTCICDY